MDWSNESLPEEVETGAYCVMTEKRPQRLTVDEQQRRDIADLLDFDDPVPSHSKGNGPLTPLIMKGPSFGDDTHNLLKQFVKVASPTSTFDQGRRTLERKSTDGPLSLSKLSPTKQAHGSTGPMDLAEINASPNRENLENGFDKIRAYLELSQKSLERSTDKFKTLEKKEARKNHDTDLLERLRASYVKVEALKKDVEQIEESLKQDIDNERKITDAIQKETEEVKQLEEQVVKRESQSLLKRIVLGVVFIVFLLVLDSTLQLILASHNIKFMSISEMVNADRPVMLVRKLFEDLFGGNSNRLVPS